MKSSVFSNVLGVDLGTTNSVVTAYNAGKVPVVLKSKSGETTPSCIMFNEDGTYTIGKPAYAQRYKPNVVYSFKKHMGSSRKVYGNLTARDCSAIFLRELLAEVKELNPQYKNYNTILVSVPAYFDINQVVDTKQAVVDSGCSVYGVEKEPVAAAINYQQIKRIAGDILVFDLGGGTFDAVLIRNIVGIPEDSREFYKKLGITLPNVKDVLEVLDVSGDNHLGGDDIDIIAVNNYLKKTKLKVTEEQYQKLLLMAEWSKKYTTDMTPEFSDKVFSYQYVEDATLEVLERCKAIMMPMLQRAKTFNVHCVLCGGSTKSHLIKRELEKLFKCSYEIDPDLAVGTGNSIKYAMDQRSSDAVIVNRLAKGIGILSGGKIRFLVNKGAVIPLHHRFQARNKVPFDTTINIELFNGVNALEQVTPISVISLTDMTGHDKDGFVAISIDLHITSDSTVSVSVSSGDASVKSELVLTDVSQEKDYHIHENAKYYHRFNKAAQHYNNQELDDKVEVYRLTGDSDTAREIMKLINTLAEENKKD